MKSNIDFITFQTKLKFKTLQKHSIFTSKAVKTIKTLQINAAKILDINLGTSKEKSVLRFHTSTYVMKYLKDT